MGDIGGPTSGGGSKTTKQMRLVGMTAAVLIFFLVLSYLTTTGNVKPNSGGRDDTDIVTQNTDGRHDAEGKGRTELSLHVGGDGRADAGGIESSSSSPAPLFLSILGVEGTGHHWLRPIFEAVADNRNHFHLYRIEHHHPSVSELVSVFRHQLSLPRQPRLYWDGTSFSADEDHWAPDMTTRVAALRVCGFRHRVLYLYRDPLKAATSVVRRYGFSEEGVVSRSLEYIRLFVQLGGGMEDKALFSKNDYRILNYDDVHNHKSDEIIAALERWVEPIGVAGRDALVRAVNHVIGEETVMRASVEPSEDLVRAFKYAGWDRRFDDFMFDKRQQLLPLTFDPVRGGPLVGE
eukprot:TRINITY_DN2541_c0_g1_i1.p1 TRINITY_DN2541_c0_g1~~TRINITY_DN2541_c0_g1_i1.p1  ORF type:complete len:348 (-),score=51.09 TRINITY_DN2541_c0_g1_i1:19-1062(-)